MPSSCGSRPFPLAGHRDGGAISVRMRVDTGRLRVVAHDAAEAEALPQAPSNGGTASGVAPRKDGLPSPGAYIEAQRLRRGMSIEQLAAVTKIPARSIRWLEADRFEELPGQVFVKGFLRCCARSLGVSQQAVMDLLYERERTALLERRGDRSGDRSESRAMPTAPAQTYEGEEDESEFEAHDVDREDMDREDMDREDMDPEHSDPEDADPEDLEGRGERVPSAVTPEALRAATRARRRAEVAAKKSEVRTRGGKRRPAAKNAGPGRDSRRQAPRYPTRGGSAPRTVPANEVGPRHRPPKISSAAASRNGGLAATERLRTLVPSAHALLWIVVAVFVAFLVLAAFNLAGTPGGMPQS